MKTSARRSAPNGDAKIAPMIVEPTDDSKNDLDDDTSKSASEEKKVGPSGRRGKGQRGKRMLRQKRRSTGVVNKEDLEDIEPTNTVSDLCTFFHKIPKIFCVFFWQGITNFTKATSRTLRY